MYPVYIIINAGRSGSTFLADVLQKNGDDNIHVMHEDIPVQVCKPRYYNRAYDIKRQREILRDEKLIKYITRWRSISRNKSVIETGWTVYHMLPIFRRVFKDKLRIVILHRNPIAVALSRAAMGNYHKDTFYDKSHEVSPFDEHSIAPEKKGLWFDMNPFEKCLFWWYVVYREAFEFKETHPEIPCFELSSDNLFRNDEIRSELFRFLGLQNLRLDRIEGAKTNRLNKFGLETFPISDEWKNYCRHKEILEFAKNKFNYQADYELVRGFSAKYRRPPGIDSWLRWRTGYWKKKRKLKHALQFLKPDM